MFYATSNRRHLMPRDMMENERSTAITPHEAVEEKVSLSDRFGLWLGFHNCSQDEYLAMVRGYADHYALAIGEDATDGRGAGVGDHPRRPLRPRRLAVRSGSGGAAWGRPLGTKPPRQPVLIRPVFGGQDLINRRLARTRSG